MRYSRPASCKSCWLGCSPLRRFLPFLLCLCIRRRSSQYQLSRMQRVLRRLDLGEMTACYWFELKWQAASGVFRGGLRRRHVLHMALVMTDK